MLNKPIPEYMQFIGQMWSDYGPYEQVVELGSKRENYPNIRDLLLAQTPPPGKITGIDLRAGENVELVGNTHELAYYFAQESVDMVVSWAFFEHDNLFWRTLADIYWILKPSGTLCVAVPGFDFPQHNCPSDYYRFTTDAVRDGLFETYGNVVVRSISHKKQEMILGYGTKRDYDV